MNHKGKQVSKFSNMLQLKTHSLRANAHVDGEGMISAVLKKDPTIFIMCL